MGASGLRKAAGGNPLASSKRVCMYRARSMSRWFSGARHGHTTKPLRVAGSYLISPSRPGIEIPITLIDPWTMGVAPPRPADMMRSEEHTSELQSLRHLVCRLLLEKKKKNNQ